MCRRLLVWALFLVGLVEFFAFAAVVMPRSWMAAHYAWLGVGAMPDGPVFDSVMRQVSFSYGLHGIALWLIATDVDRYRPLVWLTGIGYLLAGPAFLIIDSLNAMPWSWRIGNGGSCILVGLVVLGLMWGKSRFKQASQQPPTQY